MEWPGWLKCSETGVGKIYPESPSVMVIQDRYVVFPETFIELALCLPDVLRVALLTLD